MSVVDEQRDRHATLIKEQIETLLHDLATKIEPDEVVDFVESVARRMRRELDEVAS